MSTYTSLGLPSLMVRAELAVDRKSVGDLGGVDAVIYSAMAAEAFPNDFAHMASIFFLDENDNPVSEIVAASQILSELEEQRAQTKTKYQVLYYILAKKPFPVGEQLWSDFDLLIRLRNEIVHPKPENIIDLERGTQGPSRSKKLLDRLRQRRLIDRPEGAEPYEWDFALEDNDIAAKWSIKVAKSIIQLVARQAPPSKLREIYLSKFIDSKYLESRYWPRQKESNRLKS